MRLTVLGGCGAWPGASQACSGYMVEEDGFRLLIDPGYATVPRLLDLFPAQEVDAVLVSHGHPDHCADLNPLLRSRSMQDDPAPALPVHALPGAVDPVLALDRPETLAGACLLHEFDAGASFAVGPFEVQTWPLPHFVPNAGVRLTADGQTLAYTGDTGPSSLLVDLARHADLFLAEATFADAVPRDSAASLSSARQAGENGARAAVGRLVLTHLWPGSDIHSAAEAAGRAYRGPIAVARPGLVIDLDGG